MREVAYAEAFAVDLKNDVFHYVTVYEYFIHSSRQRIGADLLHGKLVARYGEGIFSCRRGSG